MTSTSNGNGRTHTYSTVHKRILRRLRHPYSNAVVAACVGGAVLAAMPTSFAQTVASLMIGSLGGFYCGFAANRIKDRNQAFWQEFIGFIGFAGVGVWGLQQKWQGNAKMIGVGLAAHALYDMLHYFNLVPYRDHVPHNYPIFCIVFDLWMGGFLYWLWS